VLALTAAGTSGAAAEATAPQPSGRPNIVIYLVDTLRADRLGCYGYARPTSPNIDAFARESVLFREAEAQSAWTKATVASILTGLYPRSHGANDWPDRLSPELPNLAVELQNAGYATAAFVSSAVVTKKFAFDRGFEVFEQRVKEEIETTQPTSAWVNDHALAWLRRRQDGRPFFLYLHSLDPHAPYTPAEPFLSRFAADVADPSVGTIDSMRTLWVQSEPPPRRAGDLSALQDAEIAGNDASFGQLIAALRQAQLYDSTVVLLISDHGEGFFEHRTWQHGNSLHGELVRVPFILRLPGTKGAGRVVHAPVEQIDVLPTLLAAAGLDAPAGIQGRNLLGWVNGDEDPARWALRPVYGLLEFEKHKLASLRQGHQRLIVNRAAPDQPEAQELYDIAADPGETRDLATTQRAMTRHLREIMALLETRTARSPLAQQATIDDETWRLLRSLGYFTP
jgi:choline-sulfatase